MISDELKAMNIYETLNGIHNVNGVTMMIGILLVMPMLIIRLYGCLKLHVSIPGVKTKNSDVFI